MTAAGFSLAQATTLIFSIKEALYKAVFPVVQKLFGFEQATVTAVNPLLNQISLELSPAIWPAQHGPSSWQAHYWQSDSEVLSWLVAPRS